MTNPIISSIDDKCPKSKVTGGATTKIFSARVLGKYDVSYFRCCDTGFIQTEAPYWLDESYKSAITSLDIGYVSRNIACVEFVSNLIESSVNQFKYGVDFGGGYGMFVRRMRDIGFAFFRQDAHCDNLFAKHFDIQDSPVTRFDLLTCFEVFEHVEEPLQLIEEALGLSDTIVFSTTLIPATGLRSCEDWWYFCPETGQHISFYTQAALFHLAETVQARYFTNGFDRHIFTLRSDFEDPWSLKRLETPKSGISSWLHRFYQRPTKDSNEKRVPAREGLLQSDFDYVRNLNRKALSGSIADPKNSCDASHI